MAKWLKMVKGLRGLCDMIVLVHYVGKSASNSPAEQLCMDQMLHSEVSIFKFLLLSHSVDPTSDTQIGLGVNSVN